MSLALIRPAPADRPQPRAAARGRARDRRGGRARAAARHRRRGLRQDGDARPSGGGAHPRRRRSEAHHARDLFAPRRGRARPAGRAAARAPPCAGSRGRRRARLFRHVPRHRRAALARIRAAPRPRSAIHHPRPRGFGRPHELGAARGGAQRDEGALPDQGDLPRHLFARRQRPRRARRDARQMVPLGRGARRRACAPCSALTSRRSSARTCSITTTSCSISPRCWPSPTIAAEVAARFDHLLVDEYQDTNALQAEIVLALRPNGRGLTVVGDDAQSIYSFRAATVRNILDFPHAFDPPARVVTLDRNYRSTQADPRRRQRRDRARARALRQGPVDRPRRMDARPRWSPSPRRPIRRDTSRPACSPIARRAPRSNRRRCCFAPRTTAPRSSSSSPGATSPSSSSAASSSSTPRM